ncbi:hypothetical protein [Mariniluteicoccus flavus]
MTRTLALVDSPAQLLNAVEWAYATGEHARIVQVGPPDPTNRLQMHRVGELARASGFSVGWCEARLSRVGQVRALGSLAPLVASADRVVLGDPYAGIAHLLLHLAPRDVEVVVVDDGTATLHYARQWASSAPLQRWHLDTQPRLARVVSGRARKLLGDRSSRVSLFTAMPVDVDMPQRRNAYAWARSLWGPPGLLESTDLLGSSLVETGVVGGSAYLAGVRRLVADRGVARYLPHRRESRAKLAAIAALGVEIVRPDLPMELWARRGPIGRTLMSFPSTVLHTLPLVLGDAGVTLEGIGVEDAWFTDAADSVARGFVRGI